MSNFASEIFTQIQEGNFPDSQTFKTFYFYLKAEKTQKTTLENLFSCFIQILNSLKDLKSPNQKTGCEVFLRFLDKFLLFLYEKEKDIGNSQLSGFSLVFSKKILEFFIESFETAYCQIQSFSSRAIST